jgi:sortase A
MKTKRMSIAFLLLLAAVLIGDTSFSFLADIRTGDSISLQSRTGKELNYTVISTAVERSDHLFFENTTSPWLTLITCYPFDSPVPGGPFRFIVFAGKDPGPGGEATGTDV